MRQPVVDRDHHWRQPLVICLRAPCRRGAAVGPAFYLEPHTGAYLTALTRPLGAPVR
jgi:hypothetical protein